MTAEDSNQWVLYSGIVATVVGTGVVIFGRLRLIVEPVGKWWSTRKERKLLRQAEIEAAALILNDQRIVALTEQVRGLAAELAAARVEISELRRELAEERKAAELRAGGVG